MYDVFLYKSKTKVVIKKVTEMCTWQLNENSYENCFSMLLLLCMCVCVCANTYDFSSQVFVFLTSLCIIVFVEYFLYFSFKKKYVCGK